MKKTLHLPLLIITVIFLFSCKSDDEGGGRLGILKYEKPVETIIYDDQGNIKQSWNYEYDSKKRVIKKISMWRVPSETILSGNETNYTYDGLTRFAEIMQLPDKKYKWYEKHEFLDNSFQKVTRYEGEGIEYIYNYDSQKRLIQYKYSYGTTLAIITYTYDGLVQTATTTVSNDYNQPTGMIEETVFLDKALTKPLEYRKYLRDEIVEEKNYEYDLLQRVTRLFITRGQYYTHEVLYKYNGLTRTYEATTTSGETVTRTRSVQKYLE